MRGRRYYPLGWLWLVMSMPMCLGQAVTLTGNWSTDYLLDSTPADDDIIIMQINPYTPGTQRHTTFLDWICNKP